MPSEPLFRADAYLRECEAAVTALTPEGGIVLDRTVLYAQGGGQPGDAGTIVGPNGAAIPVANTVYAPDRATIVHVPADPGAPVPPVGARVRVLLDWERRWPRMRVHTALHLLSVVLPYPVTGGSIGEGEGRLDFDIQDAGLDKAEISGRLGELVARDAAVTDEWITDAELDANPGLVRLVRIAGIDLQPCGGTHVGRTGEIGAVAVTDVEKKGRHNRRVRLRLG